MKIRPAQWDLSIFMRSDKLTDTTKLKVAFPNFTKTYKN